VPVQIEPESFRYDTSGRWYKGNTHLHTTASDGGKTLAEVGELYAGVGYDFAFVTDHGIASHVESELTSSPLLWLDGIEIEGRDDAGASYHVVCLGKIRPISPETPFVDAIQSARAQNALLVLAHPHWTGNTLQDALRWQFDGVEIYNHVCRWLNGKGDGLVYWEAMLRQNPDTLAFSADDAHLRPEQPGWNGGWIVVNAATCSQEEILRSIRQGNYYSSCGPEFTAIEFDGTDVHIGTSPVQFVRLVGPTTLGKRVGGFDGKEISSACMTIPTEWDYVYVEIEDRRGRRAWTNTLFTHQNPQEVFDR
jgi:hypothetical protein